jgi:hypothetical protein
MSSEKAYVQHGSPVLTLALSANLQPRQLLCWKTGIVFGMASTLGMVELARSRGSLSPGPACPLPATR